MKKYAYVTLLRKNKEYLSKEVKNWLKENDEILLKKAQAFFFVKLAYRKQLPEISWWLNKHYNTR